MNLTKLLNKVESRLTREFVHLPIVSDLAKKSYDEKVSEYKSQLPILNSEDRKIVDALRQEGAFVTTLDQLSIPKTTEAVNAAIDLLLNSSNFYVDDNCKGLHGIPGQVLQEHPEITLWALDERLINIAESYIGLPILYLGAEVKRDYPTGEFAGVRKWHIDSEDYRIVKIIIYLNDVDEKGATFQYIPRDKSAIAKKDLGYKFGLLTDELMAQYVPRQDWIGCVGKQYTTVIVDTANVFHRAKPSFSKERLSITHHYMSQYPIHLRSNTKKMSISSEMEHVCKNLSKRQLACLYSD